MPVKSIQEEFKITEEEKKVIIQKLADRFRDYVFIAAEVMTQRMLTEFWDQPYYSDNTYSLEYKISQVLADALVTLGEHRRKHASNQP